MTRIAALRTQAVNITPKTNWVFVELVTDDGVTGAGEASLNGWEAPMLAHAAKVAGALTGADERALAAAVRYAPHSPAGLIAHAFASALEQAWTDNAARRAGKPVSEYLGGARRTRVPVYANINRATVDRTPAGFAASAQRAVAQ